MKIISIIGAILAILGITNEFTGNTEEVEIKEVVNTFGSEGALVDNEFTLEEMLIYALEDEYRAKEEYLYVVDTFGADRPFTNIIESEETHIQLLLPLFETYDVELVDSDVLDHLIPAATLSETFEVGVQAEISNIAMYDAFLTQELPDDVREVFIRLRDASYNHLSAFENGLESNGTFGSSKRNKRKSNWLKPLNLKNWA